MRLLTDLLAIFGKHPGVQDPLDAQVEVPGTLLPTLEIPEPLRLMLTGELSPEVQQTSFALETTYTLTNAAGFTNSVFILAPGLWDIDIFISVDASHTDLTENHRVDMFIPGTSNGFFFLQFTSIANVQNHRARRVRLSLPDGLELKSHMDTQGVGETAHLNISAVCTRLG